MPTSGAVPAGQPGTSTGPAARGTSYVVLIPDWHPTRLNEIRGRHAMVAHRRRKADTQFWRAYCHLAGVPKAKGKRRLTLTIGTDKGKQAGDPDAYWKLLLDSLKGLQLLVDDSSKWVELTPLQVSPGTGKATTLIIQELPGE